MNIWILQTLDGRQVYVQGVGTYTLEKTDREAVSMGDRFTRAFRKRVAESHLGKDLQWVRPLKRRKV
jgi:hypothetical protein